MWETLSLPEMTRPATSYDCALSEMELVMQKWSGFLTRFRDESLTTAGERGLGALVLAFDGPPEVERKNAMYREAYAKRDPKKQVGYRPINHLAALCRQSC